MPQFSPLTNSRLLTNLSNLGFIYQVLTWALLLMIGSCAKGNLINFHLRTFSLGTNITPIAKIKPMGQPETTVYIQGKIEKHAPLIGQQAYQIADSTGKIWVVINQNKLQLGQEVVLRGKIKYKSINLHQQEYGEVYLEEE
ncbi:hypothetical protein [Cylindrospermopsis curvispora]|uniref:Uncharacterized protein n=1 Tax=Cylindrospermopsis curvispora GIHE-G1 TaxID=2666332 RepID=A0A7H0F2I3_9CYAN|nr:hypothetical protein [Cylindrospermopsis curvispora]QNP30249.1 hypothetical protein IAR63_04060 [Cylindrospermopsis curvispora GIHE-G1]